MALKRSERYPGRFDNPTTEHPQGAFKNRTSPTSQDGSYLEKDWANDWDAYFSWLLSQGSVVANGSVDTATSSQYGDALRKITLNRSNPGADINADGTQATFRANVGIGTAGTRTIGTASNNNVPDMSSFIRSLNSTGYQKLPGGLTIQWGTGAITGTSTTVSVDYPVPFQNAPFGIYATDTGGASTTYGTTARSATGFTLVRNISSGSTVGFWLAIGL